MDNIIKMEKDIEYIDDLMESNENDPAIVRYLTHCEDIFDEIIKKNNNKKYHSHYDLSEQGKHERNNILFIRVCVSLIVFLSIPWFLDLNIKDIFDLPLGRSLVFFPLPIYILIISIHHLYIINNLRLYRKTIMINSEKYYRNENYSKSEIVKIKELFTDKIETEIRSEELLKHLTIDISALDKQK